MDEDGQSLEKLMRVSVIVLRQAVDLVNTSLTEDGQLSYVSKYIPGSTIGMYRSLVFYFSHPYLSSQFLVPFLLIPGPFIGPVVLLFSRDYALLYMSVNVY